MTGLIGDPAASVPTETRIDLRTWHARSWRGPLVVFVATFGGWLLAFAVGVWSESWWVRAALLVPLTALAGQLFTIGHDAAHGSFSSSRSVNGFVGRLAFVPSLHVFGLWRLHHDVHHRFTNLRGYDFVWTPLTAAEFRSFPRWRQWLHRAYRHRSGLGLGLHYAIEIWAPRTLWPRACRDVPQRGRLFVDAVALYGMIIGLAAGWWWFVTVVDPERSGSVEFWGTVVLLFVLPLIGTHWLIGFVIYLNHTHPEIVWFDDPAEWSRHQIQLEGAAGQQFDDRLRHVVLPRRVLSHTAHHVDPGVPLRELDAAQRHLLAVAGDRIVSWQWSRRQFHEILTRCKLYDYRTKRWQTFAASEEQP